MNHQNNFFYTFFATSHPLINLSQSFHTTWSPTCYSMLKNQNSLGNNGIPVVSPFFVRCITKELSLYLCELFCYTFEDVFFPADLKLQVLSINKSGFNFEMMNYHPISLLTCFSKILEKLLRSFMELKFLDKHNIFYTITLIWISEKTLHHTCSNSYNTLFFYKNQ